MAPPRSFAPFFLLLLVTSPKPASPLDNGLGRVPPGAWSSWNPFASTSSLNASAIMAQADAIVAHNLSHIYRGVHIDCGWSLPQRAPDGSLQPDPQRFPDGIAAVANYVNSKGLELGLYTEHFTADCCGGPGMYGYYEQDARTFASWNVSFLKVDSCAGHSRNASEQWDDFSNVARALNATGKPIFLSICPTSYTPAGVVQPFAPWGGNLSYSAWFWTNGTDPSFADPGVLANSILVEFGNSANSFDVTASWNVDAQTALVGWQDFTRPSTMWDSDMLTLGCSDAPVIEGTPCAPGADGAMTYDAQVAQFSLWSIFASPLILGSDLRFLSNATLSIIGNAEVVAVDTDPLMYRGRLVYDSDWNSSSSSSLHPSAAADQNIVVAPCDGSLAQAWEFQPDGSIRSAATGLCLDVWDCGTVPGTVVDLFACHIGEPACGNATASTNQIWSRAANGTNTSMFTLTSALGSESSELCLDLYEWVGPQVDLWPCGGTTNQQWIFNNSTGSLSAASFPSHCLTSAQPPPPHAAQVYAKILSDGSRAAVLFNRLPNTPANITVTWEMVQLGQGAVWAAADVRDLWLHADVGEGVVGGWTAQVPAQGVVMLRLTESSG
jgi:alpha-galactosidase